MHKRKRADTSLEAWFALFLFEEIRGEAAVFCFSSKMQKRTKWGSVMTLAGYLNSQFSLVQNIDFFIRMLVACLCGAAIGVERSRRSKEAGVRTHSIVCCASALLMIVSKYGFVDLTSVSGALYNGTRGADASRIAAQVVSGVSFLGAGVIFKNGSTIKGLTTAAGLWATAGIGLAIGSGMFVLGIFATFFITLMQVVMHKLTLGMDSMVINQLKFTVHDNEKFREKFSDYIAEHKMQIVESKISRKADGSTTYTMLLKSAHGISLHDVDFLVESNEEVESISCTSVV